MAFAGNTILQTLQTQCVRIFEGYTPLISSRADWPGRMNEEKVAAEVLDNITEDDILFYDNWAEQQDSGALSV